MGLILLEALGALLLLVLIVWWTMFSGRRHGEPIDTVTDDTKDSNHALPVLSDTQANQTADQQAPTRGKP
jgi:hypothetical protein